MKSMNFLNDGEIKAMGYDSLFATEPYKTVSDKYSFVPTIEVINNMRDLGWGVAEVSQSRVKIEDKYGFQKHLVRMRHPELILDGGEFMEALIFNSHDLTAMYKFYLGVYRMVCSNGLVVGSNFSEFKTKHLGEISDDIIEITDYIVKEAPNVAGEINGMKRVGLHRSHQEALASASLRLVYNEDDSSPINPSQLLETRRPVDNRQDLWTTFNTIQENIVKGGLVGKASTGRKVRTKGIRDINRNVKLNKSLWTLASEVVKLAA